MILKFFLLVLFSILINAQDQSRVRKPKIFYVSTQETSTTISTHTVGYKTSTTHTQCTRRKRSMEMIQKLRDADVEIKASSVDVAEGKDGLEATEEDLLERNPELQGSRPQVLTLRRGRT